MSPMFGPFGSLDRADAPVVGRVDVPHLEACSLAGKASPGPSAESRRLCVTDESGFVWSMNWESWLEPKNSLITAETGFELIRSWGMSVSISWRRHPLLDRALHAYEPDPVLVLEQLAHDANPAVAEVIDVVDTLGRIGAVLEIDQVLDRGRGCRRAAASAARRARTHSPSLALPDPVGSEARTRSSPSNSSLWLTLSRPTRDRS